MRGMLLPEGDRNACIFTYKNSKPLAFYFIFGIQYSLQFTQEVKKATMIKILRHYIAPAED